MPAFPYEAESIDAPQEEQRHADAASRKSRVKSVHTCLPRREPSEALASEARVSISRRRQNAKASVQPIALSGVSASSGRRSEVDDAPAECDRDRLRAVVDLKLGKDIPHVHLDRVFRDRELAGDLLVSFAGRHQRQHLELAWADRLITDVLGQLLGQRGRKAPLPRVNAADDVQQFAANDSLDNISLRSGL